MGQKSSQIIQNITFKPIQSRKISHPDQFSVMVSEIQKDLTKRLENIKITTKGEKCNSIQFNGFENKNDEPCKLFDLIYIQNDKLNKGQSFYLKNKIYNQNVQKLESIGRIISNPDRNFVKIPSIRNVKSVQDCCINPYKQIAEMDIIHEVLMNDQFGSKRKVRKQKIPKKDTFMTNENKRQFKSKKLKLKQIQNRDRFQDTYLKDNKKGIYICKLSKEALFSSKEQVNVLDQKGFLQFDKPMQKQNVIKFINKLDDESTIQIKSKKGNNILGSVFNHSQQTQSGQIYSVQQSKVDFIPAQQLTELGYGQYYKTWFKDQLEVLKNENSSLDQDIQIQSK